MDTMLGDSTNHARAFRRAASYPRIELRQTTCWCRIHSDDRWWTVKVAVSNDENEEVFRLLSKTNQTQMITM